MEILVRVIDKGPDIDHSKCGDVIAVCPDGWAWSQEELTNDYWRIIKAPILQTHAESLLAISQQDTIALKRRRRDWTIDFSKFPDPTLFSGVRGGHIVMTRQQVQAATSRKL